MGEREGERDIRERDREKGQGGRGGVGGFRVACNLIKEVDCLLRFRHPPFSPSHHFLPPPGHPRPLLAPVQHLPWDFGFRIQIPGFRFGFRISGSGFRFVFRVRIQIRI